MLMLAASGRGHHAGIFLLVIIVIIGLIFFYVRLSARRDARGHGVGRGSAFGRAVPTPPGPPGGSQPEGSIGAAPTDQPPAPAPPGMEHGVQALPTGASDRASGGGAAADVAPAVGRAAGAATGGDGDWAVETHGLVKRFGTNVAVNEVELLVPRGCAFGYLGPNGAGKTTLIRTLLGLTRADGGTMSLLGIPVPRERSRALARVGAIVDEPRFHDHLTGRENLSLLAAARGGDAGGRIDEGFARVGLRERADDKVASYSMGMRQRLGVAACLLGDPELLILDEPMNGLDPAGMASMRAMIKSLVAEGRTVMLSSHLLDEVERTCDAVAIVDRGRVIRQGPIDELLHGTADIVVRVDCDDAVAAARVIDAAGIALAVAVAETGLTVTLRAGTGRGTVAEINRRLVEAGIAVYSFQEVRTTLEDWFLSVTSRFGDHP
jgi:ABC-2 type transport system ATP-binding protein